MVAVGLLATCAGAVHAQGQGAINWYVVCNAYDNTADNMWYYSYEIFGTGAGDQTLSQWWLFVPGLPRSMWTEVAGSPLPLGIDVGGPGLPYGGDWSDASGYTNGYSWQPATEVVWSFTNPPAAVTVPLSETIWWPIDEIKNFDRDGVGGTPDNVWESVENGVDSGYLSGYAHIGTSPPVSPGTVANTDVAAGWFQIKSPNPPMKTTYVIQDGVGQWFGTVCAPTPEPTSLALLALGLPMGLGALRRRNKKA